MQYSCSPEEITSIFFQGPGGMGPGGVDNGPPGVGGPPGSGTPGPSLNGEPLPGGGTMEMKRSPGTAPTTPSQAEFFGGGGENVSFSF